MGNAFSEPILKNEGGFSLAEILVGVGLFVVLSTVVVTVLLNANKTSENSAVKGMTQQELLDATSRVTHDVAAAQKILVADSDHLKISLNEAGEEIIVSYFAYDGATLPAKVEIDESLLPDVPTIMEFRHDTTDSKDDIVRPLVTGYQARGDAAVFDYFAEDPENPMATPVADGELNTIKRISFRFVSFTEGNTAPSELTTSITPRTILGLDGDEGVFGAEDPSGGTNNDVQIALTGSLPSRSTSADLSWSPIEGAANYTLTRYDTDPDATLPLVTIYTGMENSFVDTSVVRGHSYIYLVTGTTIYNEIARSNEVRLTATPPAPVLAISESGLTHTLSWDEVKGATGYRLYRVGASSPIATQSSGQDSYSYAYSNPSESANKAPYYGKSESYYVVAFNGSGDTSEDSNRVTGITPPLPPELVGSHKDGVRLLNHATSPTATSYEIERVSPQKKNWTRGTNAQLSDSDEIDDPAFTYRVRATNRTGTGTWGSPITINPRPATPHVIGKDWHTGWTKRNGVNWFNVPNATEYGWSKDSTTNFITTTSTSKDDPSPRYDSRHTYRVRACNITGCSKNGWVKLEQAPGPFTISKANQTKQGKYKETIGKTFELYYRGNETAKAVIKWSASSGAGSYRLNSHNTKSKRTYSFKPSGGRKYTLNVYAKGKVTGIEVKQTYKFFSAPTSVTGMPVTVQTHSGRAQLTRMKYSTTGKYRKLVSDTPADGTHHIENKTWYAERKGSSKYSFSSTHTFAKWNGKNKYTPKYDKKNVHPYHKTKVASVGAIAAIRTVKSIPAGYHGGTTVTPKGVSDWTPKSTSIFSPGADTSVSGFLAHSTGLSNRWTGSYSGSKWVTVPYSHANYPDKRKKGATGYHLKAYK